ncbi:uncharacterized protein LOC132559856 [Ylistrum balloti]|uniref:uncharacterized protein LOC132559856 n=1 Tax=Ylistrum balloti TaxID=509963 RepID=UPI002905BC44|nr:uncharacterized protein LOC132559856 [Ylistrum balloti]
MERFFIIGACVLAIGSICIHTTNGATTSSPPMTTNSQTDVTSGSSPATVTDVVMDDLNNVTTCPRYTYKLENETLYVSYIENSCEMVVTVEKLSLPPLKRIEQFKRRPRVIRRPVVSFRPVLTEGEPVSCEALPNRSLGPFVFVDTVTDDCQMLIKIQKQKNEDFIPRVPGEKRPERRPGKGLGKRPKNPRFKFVPAFEYLDEIVY